MKTKDEVIASWCQFAERYHIECDKWQTVDQIKKETGLRIHRNSIALNGQRMKYANGDFFPVTPETRVAFGFLGNTIAECGALNVALKNGQIHATMLVYLDEFSPVPGFETEPKTIFWRKREYAIVDRNGQPVLERIWVSGDVVSAEELTSLPVGTKLEVTEKGLVIA